jgi:hypothetical protein
MVDRNFYQLNTLNGWPRPKSRRLLAAAQIPIPLEHAARALPGSGQCLGRDDQWPVQSRSHSPPWPLAQLWSCRMPRSNGSTTALSKKRLGSTTTVCWNLSGISHQQKLRQTSTPLWKEQIWQHGKNKSAFSEPGGGSQAPFAKPRSSPSQKDATGPKAPSVTMIGAAVQLTQC